MKKSPERGFTLVEMIVSVGLFAVVMTIASGAYLSLINIERKARALSDLMTNLSFATESMARAIRTGTNYSCNGGGDCASGTGTTFTFVNDQGVTTTYLTTTANTVGQCDFSGCNSSTATTLTDPRIKNFALSFTLRGSSPSDTIQPYVIFTVSGTITPDANTTPIPFNIQTSASQRILDLP